MVIAMAKMAKGTGIGGACNIPGMRKSGDKGDNAENKTEFYRELWRLGAPLVLQNLLTLAIGIVDNVSVSSLGEDAVAGVYLGNTVQMILQMLIGGIEATVVAMASQYYGKKDKNGGAKTALIGTGFALCIGALLTLVCTTVPGAVVRIFTDNSQISNTGVGYLRLSALSFLPFCLTQSLISAMRSIGHTELGFYTSLSSILIHLPLNYILIYGKFGFSALGIYGAAISTVTSRLIEAAVAIFFTLRHKEALGIKYRETFKFDKGLTASFIRLCTPIMLGQAVWAFNNLSATAIIGRSSTSGALAAAGSANAAWSLAYVSANAVAGALAILTAGAIGEGNQEKLKEYTHFAKAPLIIIGIFTAALLFTLRFPIISLYNLTGAAAKEAEKLILTLVLTSLATPYQLGYLFGFIKSGGDAKFVMICDAVFVFFIILPGALIATRLGAPLWLVFFLLKCDQLLKCPVARLKIKRFDWIKRLTSHN